MTAADNPMDQGREGKDKVTSRPTNAVSQRGSSGGNQQVKPSSPSLAATTPKSEMDSSAALSRLDRALDVAMLLGVPSSLGLAFFDASSTPASVVMSTTMLVISLIRLSQKLIAFNDATDTETISTTEKQENTEGRVS